MDDNHAPTPRNNRTPPLPRWAVMAIVTLAALLAATAAGILARVDGASIASSVQTGGAAFAAAVGLLLATAIFLCGK